MKYATFWFTSLIFSISHQLNFTNHDPNSLIDKSLNLLIVIVFLGIFNAANDKSFSHIIALEKHVISHAREKPYKCSQCKKTFSDNNNLKIHLKIYTEETPYQCSECDKAFSNNTILNNICEQLTHNREKTKTLSM